MLVFQALLFYCCFVVVGVGAVAARNSVEMFRRLCRFKHTPP